MLTSQLGTLPANVSGRDTTTCERSSAEQCGLKWGSRSVVVGLWKVVCDHSVLCCCCCIHYWYSVLQQLHETETLIEWIVRNLNIRMRDSEVVIGSQCSWFMPHHQAQLAQDTPKHGDLLKGWQLVVKYNFYVICGLGWFFIISCYLIPLLFLTGRCLVKHRSRFEAYTPSMLSL